MPRLGDPKTILALAVLVLAAMVVKAEFWPDPIDQPNSICAIIGKLPGVRKAKCDPVRREPRQLRQEFGLGR